MKKITIVTLLLCWTSSGSAQPTNKIRHDKAQHMDEPGVSPNDPSPLPPPSPTPVPPSLPSSASQPTATSAGSDVIRRAKRICRPRSTCPHFADLIRELNQPKTGALAVAFLGDLGDPRALLPLCIAAVYGLGSNIQAAAHTAIAALVSRPSIRPIAIGQSRTNPDPLIRQLLKTAIGSETDADAADVESPPTGVWASAEVGEEGSTSKYGFSDPAQSRAIWGYTAFSQPKGSWSATSYNIGYWLITYGVNDYLEVGLHTSLPVLILAAMPFAKLSFSLAESMKLGVHFSVGVLYPYIENDDGNHFLAYGGGPVLSIGNPDLYVNFAVNIHGLSHGEEKRVWQSSRGMVDQGMDYESAWLLTPNIGFGWRFHRRVKLNVELYMPVFEEMEDKGKVWGLLYGLRIMGKKIYGDISFGVPLFDGCEEILKYMPIGLPLLSFGFTW